MKSCPSNRVLIAGCGYVGLAVGRHLSAAGHEVFGLRRSVAAADALAAAGVKLLVGDLTDAASLRSLPRDFDWVVNCAASGGGSAEDYQRLYVRGNENLLQWLTPKPPRSFIYTSSTGVYGQDDGSVVDETCPAEPASATGHVLVAAEQLLLRAQRESGFPVIILRLAGIYGPGRGYWLNQFRNGTARLEGDGSRVLNMIQRDDVAGAVGCALERGRPGEVYNVVDDEPVRQLDLFRWLAAALDQPMPAVEDAEASSRKRGATSKRVSNRKLRTTLGWRLQFPTFREGMAALLQSGAR